jgi:hypothetical protein
MTIDLYTKAVLTVIAISLSVIAFGPAVSFNTAKAGPEVCGIEKKSPCYVAGVHIDSLGHATDGIATIQ